jgi:hypothetical protein
MIHPDERDRQAHAAVAEDNHRLLVFLKPLLKSLDQAIDRRLVATFLSAIGAILQFRHATQGLLLSELGAYILDAAHAPAGTKRLSNVLHSPKWTHTFIERFVWQQARQRIADLAAEGHDVLAVWDESVLEKPESSALEGLCAVRSRKAARLKRIKPGYFNPPTDRPIFVPGLHWLGVLVLGYEGAPTLAAMRWWTTRGERASDRRTEEARLLRQCAAAWGRRVLHVWDRGFAGSPWLSLALAWRVRFIVRWPKHYKLMDRHGRSRKAWEILRGQRTWGYRQLWDVRRRCWRKVGVVAVNVHHPDHPYPLRLVASRQGQGRAPWYLLTREPVASVDDAFQIVLAYARRWQVELTWRYGKSELAMQSPRVWDWETRLKLLLMVSLVYAFWLALLDPALLTLRQTLLRLGCHRTGKRSRDPSAPLYRLRAAISRLWLAYLSPPTPIPTLSSG